MNTISEHNFTMWNQLKQQNFQRHNRYRTASAHLTMKKTWFQIQRVRSTNLEGCALQGGPPFDVIDPFGQVPKAKGYDDSATRKKINMELTWTIPPLNFAPASIRSESNPGHVVGDDMRVQTPVGRHSRVEVPSSHPERVDIAWWASYTAPQNFRRLVGYCAYHLTENKTFFRENQWNNKTFIHTSYYNHS